MIEDYLGRGLKTIPELLTEYVERLLGLPQSVALLDAGEPVSVRDGSGSADWAKHHAAVVAQFADGWRIEPDPAHAGGYLFWRKVGAE